MDWESWLRSAARPPSDNEDNKRDRTEQQIREALNSYQPLRGNYSIYVKGSYANRTNVRLNYDVDIAVEYTGYFFSDMFFDLQNHPDSEVGVFSSTDPYTTGEFKDDIKAALVSAFGSSSVKSGRIALRVRENKTTLPADVVPSWEYRRYDRIDAAGNPVFHIGSRVFPATGPHINNFPKIQYKNGTAKNDCTHQRYKRMVRCLKKIQTYLVAHGKLDKELPSYLIECLVYNVPDWRFNADSYLSNFRAILGCIWTETKQDGAWNDWEEVHGLHYLFRGHPEWTPEQVHTLVDKAWDEVGLS